MGIMKNTGTLFEGVASVIEQARSFAGRTADLTMCAAYYEIGRRIVEGEQDGNVRAQYGRGLIRQLSAYLNARFDKGFSESTLKYARQFYTIYSDSIRQTNFGELNPFRLSWSHYLVLMRVNDPIAKARGLQGSNSFYTTPR
ncbi:MAG: DUF1016 N-terminal domain-containing protein [Clostridiales bacterium]|jgi:hypothetical protein|nr:DUF1016 N-terminal domain-containing protein [Clostridiales bacterium]